jgi:hypothetical protein
MTVDDRRTIVQRDVAVRGIKIVLVGIALINEVLLAASDRSALDRERAGEEVGSVVVRSGNVVDVGAIG